MIQRYTCFPTSEKDVLVVTNGTVSQIESKLIEINEKTENEIPFHSNFTYLKDFNELMINLRDHHNRNVNLVSSTNQDKSYDERNFNGKVVFMFFNGVEFIQNIISDLIDHSRLVSYNGKSIKSYETLKNAYFYFDSTISITQDATPSAMVNDANLFNTIVTIANDILKKIYFMVERVRVIFIDDMQLSGEKVHPLHCLIRNFPIIERIELNSFASILMNDMII